MAMQGSNKIEDLLRRIDADPTSIAFAELAEEYRREGRHAEAVKTCRLGLARHPACIAARVTLGRSLTELTAFESAQAELEQVLRVAPSNPEALDALAEVHRRRGQDMKAAEQSYRQAREATHAAPQSREIGHQPARLDARRVPGFEKAPAPTRGPAAVAEWPPPRSGGGDTGPVLGALERLLAAIEREQERQSRSRGRV